MQQQNANQLIDDPRHIQEILANELVSFAYADGVVQLTFAMQRYLPSDAPGQVHQTREVVCRLALSVNAFESLSGCISHLSAAIANGQFTPETSHLKAN